MRDEWLRADRLPHIYCAGCGNGTIMNCVLEAVTQVGWKQEETVFVSGIGCSSRAPGYIETDSIHSTHGRAIAFATGVKMANPKLNVVVFTGDGDLASIGGNHFIHACRRNIDITVVCMNNHIYGMTGGQGSPTTPRGKTSSTTPYGMEETPFDLANLAVAAGANHVARWTSYHVTQLTEAVLTGLQTPGFSLIEVRCQCPTSYGRRNKYREPVDYMNFLKTHAILKEKWERTNRPGTEPTGEDFLVGEFVRRYRPVMGVPDEA